MAEMMDEVNDSIKYQIDVANRIWDICKISPDYGNAVMDVVGEEAYKKIMQLQTTSKGE